MTVVVHIDREEGIDTPDDDSFSRWIEATLNEVAFSTGHDAPPEVSLRLNGSAEMAELNSSYRGKSGPTNVLAFPTDLPDGVASGLLGDIVICAPVVSREAGEQNKPTIDHWAHMTVHGTLHLLGYDHINVEDAERMEALEVVILGQLGCPDPYRAELSGSSTLSTPS